MLTDDKHPPEPYVPNPAHDPADGPKPGKGPDDTDDADNLPKTWDEEVAEEAGLADEDTNPVPPT